MEEVRLETPLDLGANGAENISDYTSPTSLPSQNDTDSSESGANELDAATVNTSTDTDLEEYAALMTPAVLCGFNPEQFAQIVFVAREKGITPAQLFDVFSRVYEDNVTSETRDHLRAATFPWLKKVVRGWQISLPFKTVLMTVLSGLLVNEGLKIGASEMVQRGTQEAVLTVLSAAIGLPLSMYAIKKLRDH